MFRPVRIHNLSNEFWFRPKFLKWNIIFYVHQKEVPRRHKLTPFRKEPGLYFELLLDDRALHPISKVKPTFFVEWPDLALKIR